MKWSKYDNFGQLKTQLTFKKKLKNKIESDPYIVDKYIIINSTQVFDSKYDTLLIDSSLFIVINKPPNLSRFQLF